ncbi:VanZ family protein [Streptomyces sp. NBC_01012]|uniref:VanZ family protein n=1 Tax=Streptomyces sp. NBC_01012 TaxID=2903717 RepID=UPI00386C2B05|nr:VanZ family protein [Streptomyces sp. NBC_01012]
MTAEADSGVRRRALGRLLLRVAALIAAFVALVAFSVVLAKVTLTPSPASEDLVASNLRPGRSLRQYAQDYTFLAACKQAGGNLLLGAPFGVLLPILVPRRLRMLRMTLLTVLVMALVELTQGALVVGRAFDVDDVILNTAGALLGYAFVGRRVSHRYHTLAAEKPPKGRAPATKPRPRRTKPLGKGAAGSAARRSASAPMARGRALRDRWRSRREGPGGEAPGARRRGA